jgi:hypothetical protein
MFKNRLRNMWPDPIPLRLNRRHEPSLPQKFSDCHRILRFICDSGTAPGRFIMRIRVMNAPIPVWGSQLFPQRGHGFQCLNRRRCINTLTLFIGLW